MIGDLYEPKRRFRWILSISGIDAFTLKTCTRPAVAFEPTVIDYMNVKRYFAGKGEWEPITMTLYDPIVPSAAQKVMEWFRLVFENTTGRMGYANFYQKTINLKLLDPPGAVVEEWEIVGAFPLEINGGELDYSSSDPCDLSVTLRMNQCHLLY